LLFNFVTSAVAHLVNFVIQIWVQLPVAEIYFLLTDNVFISIKSYVNLHAILFV